MKNKLFTVCILNLLFLNAFAQTDYETIYDEAMNHIFEENYQEAIRLLESIQDKGEHELFFNLGSCYYHLGDIEKATANYIEALKYDEKDFDTNYTLAVIFFENEDYINAERFLEICDEIDDQRITIVNTLILIKYKLGKIDKTEELKQRLRAIRQNSSNTNINEMTEFVIDIFTYKDFRIFAEESFELSGDLYYHWSFIIYDDHNNFVKSVNLESSSNLRALGTPYIIGTDHFENNRRIHKTTTTVFSELPDYNVMKSIVIEEIENGLEAGATGIYPMLNQIPLTMALTTQAPEVEIQLKGMGEATIDWGDGAPETYALRGDREVECTHTYSGTTAHIITVTGTNITVLNCSNMLLVNVDVSENTELEELRCRNNRLATLDVTGNPNLAHLDCSNNQLKTLDLTGNAALTFLVCSGNQLTTLDLTECTQLTFLGGNNNLFTTLDVSRNTVLEVLACSDNRLTALDLSRNVTLTDLVCRNNQLTALDISVNTYLATLGCNGNQLSTLDVSKNALLWHLDCYENQLTALDLSGNIVLKYLKCEDNQLTSLDLSKNALLQSVGCNTNRLLSIDVSRNRELTHLACFDNQLAVLDVSRNTSLKMLECGNNLLTALDVTGNTALNILGCIGNQLTTLDVTKNTALTTLVCNRNQLTVLDVSRNTTLTELLCSCNQLTTLDVRRNVELTELFCSDNLLTELDVTRNTALTALRCDGNQLTALDVNRNVMLRRLVCSGNQLRAAALNALFETLIADDTGKSKFISINDNPGTDTCNITIAKNKGWGMSDEEDEALQGPNVF